VDCKEFEKIRHLKINLNFAGNFIKFGLQKRKDNIKYEDADRKWYVTDVFNAFPDVSFTLEYDKTRYTMEENIDIAKNYHNVVFKYQGIINRRYSAFKRFVRIYCDDLTL
jgi:hypothetical protein